MSIVDTESPEVWQLLWDLGIVLLIRDKIFTSGCSKEDYVACFDHVSSDLVVNG